MIHGSVEATLHLVDYARKNLGIDSSKVCAPSPEDCVDATTESYIYQVRRMSACLRVSVRSLVSNVNDSSDVHRH